MSDFLQTLITAVSIGSLYALIALGYTMVYGILKFINFAHSDVVVLGGWFSFTLAAAGMPMLQMDPSRAPWWAGLAVLVASMVLCALAGFIIERFAYRPLRGAPRLNVLITAIGVSLLLQNTGQLQWDLGGGWRLPFGTQPQAMPALLSRDAEVFRLMVDGNPVVLTLIDATIIATAVVLMVLLQLLVYRTKMGKAMRAVSFDTRFASLMGIAVDKVISLTFMLGASLAAAAGFLYSIKFTTLQQPAHATWVLLGLKAFVAAVVGGIGNIQGAVLGGFLIAFIEQFGALYVSSDLRDVYVFAALIVVLLVKPSGLLGSTVREKV